MHAARSLALLAVGLVMVGCAHKKLIKRGDQHLRADRPIEALDAYEQALTHEPDLVEDEEFTVKWTRARVRAAHARGQLAAVEQRWDQAVAHYQAALAIDERFAPARAALPDARRKAAEMHYRRALDLADQGKLAPAITELKQALDYNADHAAARQALRSVQARLEARIRRTRDLTARATELAGGRKWHMVEQTLDQAVQTDPNHLPARIARHEARAKLSAARQAYQQGTALAEEGQLDAAIEALARAADTWPDHPQAATALTDVRRNRQAAAEHYNQAHTMFGQGRFDAAHRQATLALDIYPHWDQARDLHARAAQAAADAHAATGEELLTLGESAEAEASFLRALDYLPDHARARKGLSTIDCDRGEALAKQNRPGAALLAYLNAAEHYRSRRATTGIGQARKNIYDRIAVRLDVRTDGPGGSRTGLAVELGGAVLSCLRRHRPEWVRLAGPSDQADYAADVAELGLDVRTVHTQSHRRQHGYTFQREVPNPELIGLRQDLREQVGKLRYLRRQYALQQAGRASIRVRPKDIDRQQQRALYARDRLEDAPTCVLQTVRATWPYTVLTYVRQARIKTSLTVRDGRGRPIDAKTFSADVSASDTTIDNANPAIGLDRDELDLPGEMALRGELVADVADRLTERILAAVIAHRKQMLHTVAGKLTGAGKAPAALEAAVDAAVAGEPLNPSASRRVLDSLRRNR